MKKIKFNKYLFYCILFTILGFGVLFRIQNIFPFGKEIITFMDFDSGYIPVYYKLWDVLHFNSPLFFDWNLGAGLNSFGSFIGNGFFSPLCWIIGIFPRNTIPYTMSFVYLIKMIFVSIMTYIGIKKILPKTKEKNIVLFSLMYTFSSWTFMMSTNLLYVDAFAIYPLLVYSLKELLDKGKWKLYLVLLTLTLIFNYYIAWLDLLFIIGTTGFYLIIMDVDRKKEKAVKVLIFTLLSLLLSCISFLPGFMLTRTSTRMANNTSNDGIFAYFMDKSCYLFTLVIPFVLTIKQLFIKKDKRLNIFIIAMLLFLLLGVVIEPINALWHTGSHSGFPFRYAYQPTYFMILVSLYYLNNNYKEPKNASWLRAVIPTVGILMTLVVFIVLKNELMMRNTFVSAFYSAADYLSLLFMFIVLLISYLFVLRNNKKIAFILTILLFVVESVIFGTFYLHSFKFNSSLKMQEISEKFDFVNDGYNYVLDIEEANDNYPYILKVPSIHNRIHFIRQEEMNQTLYMGYNYMSTILRSSGSNEFFNTLLQNKYYVTRYELDDDLYELIDKKDDIYYYKSKYNLNYIIPYNGTEYKEENLDYFENANNMYKKVFDGKKDIYTKEDYKLNDKTISIDVKKDKKYYLIIDYVPTNSYSYKIANDNIEIQSLIFKDGKITYIFNSLDKFKYDMFINVDITNIKLYSFDKEEYIKFVEANNKNDVSVEINGDTKKYTYNATQDTKVLLPINYDDNYIIKVNGEVVDYKCNLYNMLEIEVKEGKNVIEVFYNQKWFKLGAKISLVTLLITILFYFINKKFRILNCKLIVWPLFIISCLAFIALIVKIYILTLI